MFVFIEIALQIVGGLSLVAAVTPTPKDDGVLLVLKRVLNCLSGNFGQAKNAAEVNIEDQIKAELGKAALSTRARRERSRKDN
jgi:hypothetical protein